jgi:hypothetical protein
MVKGSVAKRRKYFSWSNESSSLSVLADARNLHGRLPTWDGSNGRAQRLHYPAGQRAAQKPPHQCVQFEFSDIQSRLPYSSSQNNSIDVRYGLSSVGAKTPNNTLNQPPSVSWLPSHPQTGGVRCRDIPTSNQGCDHSDSSSGTSASWTSSSYTSTCESSREIDAGSRGADGYCKVKFKSPFKEDDTKFDKVIRHVESVLYKPRELFI